MDNLLGLIDKDDADFNQKCSLISEDIKDNKLTMVDLIREMADLLTNPSPSKRELGVLILKEVLRNIPYDLLSGQQLNVIAAFFTEKLNDHHQILPGALEGILIIIDFDNFPSECIPTLLTCIFQNISCQQQQRIDRYNIYLIFQKLLEKFSAVILAMGLDFVYGVITSIDGERDPRNLLFLFKWIKIFLKKVSLGHLNEEMFDVIACYFPVDFRAPPNEPTITREVLAEALCPCLCGSPYFAESCIALALEKLDSSLEIAKLDSLSLLNEGCKNFEEVVYLENAHKIVEQLEKEIFSNKNSEITQYCLQTLCHIIKKISNNDKVCVILKDIIDTTKGNLLPDSKLFETSADILLYTAKGSKLSTNYIIKEIIPLLTNTYNITLNTSHKAKLIKYLVQFAKTYAYCNKDISEENEVLQCLTLLTLKATTQSDNMLQMAGFDGLSELVLYIPFDVRSVLYNNLCTIVTQPLDSDLRKSMLHCFLNFATSYELEFREHVLNKTIISDAASLDLFLNAKCILVNLPTFREIIIENLVDHLNYNKESVRVTLENIKHLLSENKGNLEISKLFLEKSVIDILMEISLEYILKNNSDIQILMVISSVLKLLIGPQDSNVQRQIVYTHLKKVFSKAEQSQITIIILDGLVSNLRRDVVLEQNLIDFILNNALNSTIDRVRDISSQLLCIVLNKMPSDETFNDYLQTVKALCVESAKANKLNQIVVFSWITKALLMKNYRNGYEFIDILLSMLEEHIEVANGFKIIINDNYEFLGSQSHCFKMLLYRQKLFLYMTNKLRDNFSPPSLKVIGYLIEYAPQQAVVLQFQKMRQLIIMCLEKCNEVDVLCIILRTIKKMSLDNSNILEDNIEDLLDRVLDHTTYEKSMVVRIEALQCLQNFISAFPVYKLLPFKGEVLLHLSRCIDDKKRLVRKEAMDARSLWFLLDAPI